MRYTELAFTGPATFFKAPYRPLTEPWQAEVGLLGLPYDFAVGYRPGARFAPNALREASGRYAPGPEGWFDLETETYRLQGVHLVDAGDVDPAQLEYHETFRRITEAARALRGRVKLPVFVGATTRLPTRFYGPTTTSRNSTSSSSTHTWTSRMAATQPAFPTAAPSAGPWKMFRGSSRSPWWGCAACAPAPRPTRRPKTGVIP